MSWDDSNGFDVSSRRESKAPPTIYVSLLIIGSDGHHLLAHLRLALFP